jgi:uncharacterized Ntn-hydrolase superfamily protein
MAKLAVVDRYGCTAMHSGAQAQAKAAFAQGEACVVHGNLLMAPEVPARMIATFAQLASASVPERLLRTLEAGPDAGGETADERSAGLHVAEVHDWPVVDLRVDWYDEPIKELRRLCDTKAPQRATYEGRAWAPGSAPSF